MSCNDWSCDDCHDLGLTLLFRHVSFPADAPGHKTARLEPFDAERRPRAWEQDGECHRLYLTYAECRCAAGQERRASLARAKAGAGKKRNPLD